MEAELPTAADILGGPTETVNAAFDRFVARAADAHPELAPDRERLLAHVARHRHGDDPVAALDGLLAPDLAVALGCALGDDGALALLERDYLGSAKAGLSAMRLGEDLRAEVLQALRAKLLTDGDEPGIAQYAGRGSLAAWLRTAATRIALNRRRGAQRRQAREESWFADQLLPDGDPELDYVKERYRSELEQAVRLAFERLTSDQRELLRRYIVEGETLEQLAASHEVDPSTVSRWLSRIRNKLAEDARAHFAEACSLAASECESLVRLVQSDMHVSVLRLLEA